LAIERLLNQMFKHVFHRSGAPTPREARQIVSYIKG
jgi:hypothetical protein